MRIIYIRSPSPWPSRSSTSCPMRWFTAVNPDSDARARAASQRPCRSTRGSRAGPGLHWAPSPFTCSRSPAFMTAQRLHLTNPEAEPIIASLIECRRTCRRKNRPNTRRRRRKSSTRCRFRRKFRTNPNAIAPPPSRRRPSSDASTQAVAPPVVESVEYVRAPAPVYPSESNRRRERGTVVLRVLVDAHGRPAQIQSNARAASRVSTTPRATAVTKALFRPHEVNGIAHPAQVLIPIEFTRR